MQRVTVRSLISIGVESRPVDVNATWERGAGGLEFPGAPPHVAREASVRVRCALNQLDINLDGHATSVDLGAHPSSALDLPTAVAVLALLGRVPEESLPHTAFLGELTLAGHLRPVRGVLPALRGAAACGITEVVVPRENAAEAALVSGIRVRAADNVGDIIAHLTGDSELPVVLPTSPVPGPSEDLATELHLMPELASSLADAVTGHQPVLLVGPPGSGKTVIARRLASLLPPLTAEETIEATAIHSIAGLIDSRPGYLTRRPFRAPHHTVSEAGMLGGGTLCRPGEVSLAHHGVLFLDELLEFRQSTLDLVLHTIHEGQVTLSQRRERVVFPARPRVVVAATSACPCGYCGHPTRRCGCTPDMRKRFDQRLEVLSGTFPVRITLLPSAVYLRSDV